MVEIIVVANGVPWQGFTNLIINESMNAAYNTLTLATTDRLQEGIEVWNVRDGSEIDVYLDGHHVFRGDVNKYRVGLNATEHSINISAATRARDLVESSHTGRLNFKEGDTASSIITEVAAPFNIPVYMPVALSGLELDSDSLSYNIRAGTKAFDAIRRVADKDGLTVFTDSRFRLAVSDGTGYGENEGITTGDYTALSTEHDIGAAYSEVIIKSQWKNKIQSVERRPVRENYVSQTGDRPSVQDVLAAGRGTLPSSGSSKKSTFTETQQTQVGFRNTAQTRHRPLMFLNNAKPAADETYAKYLNRRFAGQQVNATVSVKSILDKSGALYELANIVNVYEPLAELNDNLIIQSRTINVSPQGGLNVDLGLTTAATYLTGVESSSARRRNVRRAGGTFSDLIRALIQDL